MRTIILAFLITANSLTSIIIIALGSSLFIFPDSETSLQLQSFTGIYLIFALLCLCEPIKWLTFKKAYDFRYHKTKHFFILYGIFLMTVSILYQQFFFSLTGVLYVIYYFVVRRIPHKSNTIIEKNTDGQALQSDSLFHPLPEKSHKDKK